MKRLITFSLVLFSILPTYAKLAKEIFIDDNIKVFESIKRNTRLDMIDYYEYGQKGEGQNKYDEMVAVDTLTDQFLSMDLSKVSHIEFWISDTTKEKAIIVLNQTYHTPATDGKLEFYSTDFRKIKTSKVIKLPTIYDFITFSSKDKEKTQKIEDLVDMQFISYSIDSESGDITATQNIDEFLSEFEYMKIKDLLKKEIKFKWTGKKYKRIF